MGLPGYKNEPYLDLSDEKNVEAMRAALKKVGDDLGKEYPLIISGERVETDSEIPSVNPANPSQVVGHVGRATEREADMALETATSAFESWSRTEPEARARILLRATATMRRRKLEMLAWEVYESGKPWAEADAQVAEAIDFLEYYAREMLRLKDGKMSTPWPAKRTSISTSPWEWASSSRRGTSRRPYSQGCPARPSSPATPLC